MARPREFDTRKAIDQAMAVFRKQGYKGSSLLDLVRAMNISKSSFYETFGSKHELFLTTLNHFDESKAIYRNIDTQSNVPAKTLITRIFEQLINNVNEGPGGCMLGNCAVEFANTDEEITNRITKGIKQLEQMFYQILWHKQQKGQISENLNIQSIARQLTTTFYGLQIMANANLDPEILNDVIEHAVTKLN